MPFYRVTVEQRFIGTQLVEGKDEDDAKDQAIRRARGGNFRRCFTGAKVTEIEHEE